MACRVAFACEPAPREDAPAPLVEREPRQRRWPLKVATPRRTSSPDPRLRPGAAPGVRPVGSVRRPTRMSCCLVFRTDGERQRLLIAAVRPVPPDPLEQLAGCLLHLLVELAIRVDFVPSQFHVGIDLAPAHLGRGEVTC